MTAHMARLMLEGGKVDVYLQPIVVTDDEDQVFDHTQPVVTHWYQLFVQRGLPEVSADSYFRAMSPTMWTMTLSALVLLSLVLRSMVRLRTALGMEAGVDPADPTASSLGSCFLTVLGSLCSQGWQDRPACLSVRVSVVTTLLFGYLLFNAYSAVLISHLASGHYTSPFASLDEVAKKGTHVLCVRNESYAYFTLKKRPAEWQHVLNRGVCRDAAQVERLADGLCLHNAAVLEIPCVMAAALEARPRCRAEVLRVNGRMQRATASLLLRRDFPYTRAIDYMITRCRVAGILDRLEKHYLDGFAVQAAGTVVGHDTVNTGVQVTLEHVRWVLLLYFCFLSVPVLVLSAECVVAWRSRVRARRRRARARATGRDADDGGALRAASRLGWRNTGAARRRRDDGILRNTKTVTWDLVDGGHVVGRPPPSRRAHFGSRQWQGLV
ncbi:hypothetical protein ONE63_004050 [Megalurothrips usitatus]|uniref:Ionotropic glutamate receptor C-terminal domain-containing protein n=1 Tax=Megalurothrips usitatus TaxID=439358 RepID=A0AAV7X4Z2_9NEOP|nr:hypothetical protein ONE63_004050 [Megalurothrips usitatus]